MSHNDYLLGPMDLVMPRANTRIIFLFSHLPADSVLDASLRITLRQHYPLWTGKLKVLDSGKLAVDHAIAGPELDTAVAAFPLHFNSAASDVTLESLAGANSNFSSIPAGFYSEPLIPKADDPVLAIVVSRLAHGGAAIGVSLHHCVGDGGALFCFLQVWSAITRGAPPPFAVVHDRAVIPTGPAPASTPAAFTLQAPTFPTSIPPMTTKLIRFSKAALASLKDKALQDFNKDPSSSPSSFLSTNDCIVGLLWAAATRARQLPLGQPTRLGMAVDGRKRNVGIPEGYAGCANYFATAQTDGPALAASGLAQAASLVRQAVAGINLETMKEYAGFISTQSDTSQIFPSFNSFLGPDFAFTSWASLLSPGSTDFGSGDAVAVRTPNAAFDGLAIFLPQAGGGEGIDVLIGLASTAMDRFLADPAILSSGAVFLN